MPTTRAAIAIAAACLAALLLTVIGFTMWGLQPHQQPDHQQFCFAEWCVTPTKLTSTAFETVVQVRIRSTALAATQRPDHPQAWLVDDQGRTTGGPQGKLNAAIGPGQEYSADLPFRVVTAGCSRFLVGEGAWPSFLQLGYAPSPFGERASWRLCA